ncbi:hypothetical protein GCM10010916_15880 [Paenibacillus abyssi]|uniref:Uncharacterized protein n=1 Tax=Paenibacillus abyssi TaxID=1340531 RepID=A0A917FSD7_9BACL|nr:hypothetical protein GCM10010916_15880 [Paenibacillus abyssi]
MDQQTTICPWCHTEIVWDEELGPEEYCPHCENELKGYRTLSLNVDNDEDEDEEMNDGEPDMNLYSSGQEEGFRSTNRSMLALEETVERILDQQEEVPECPSCREYMLETGRQTMSKEEGYEPTAHEHIGDALLPVPFQVIWYVCPTCFQMQNRLRFNDREELLRRLSSGSK